MNEAGNNPLTNIMHLYVAPDGNDNWSGLSPAPLPDNTDGPLATPAAAQARLRELLNRGLVTGPAQVWLRGGRYKLDKPLIFTPEDRLPVTYASYPGETAVLCGGERISGWRYTEVNGNPAWVTELPAADKNRWHFRQLFVNGARRPRAQVKKPGGGLFRIQAVPGLTLPGGWNNDGNNRFQLEPGSIPENCRNLQDIEIIALHFWIEERLPVADYTPETREVITGRSSRAPLVEAHGSIMAPYYVENVFEAMSEPGEWYLDRAEGRLYYLPRPGEDISSAQIYAPRLQQFVKIIGAPHEQRPVSFLRFENLHFEHADWVQPGESGDVSAHYMQSDALAAQSVRRYLRGDRAAAAQGACDVPGVIYLYGAVNCAFVNCRIAHAGWYGIELADGCRGIHLRGNEITDLGAGGIKLNGGDLTAPAWARTGGNLITDNRISAAGRVFHSATGILSMHADSNRIAHNLIHDLFYSGISCGWSWGYREHPSHSNIIEYNHIHNIGQGLLSDMGGIYILGVQPGTLVRGNLIHRVRKLNYGGWCLYADEGCSHVIFENNICFDTNGDIFNQHYGRENIVRNNVLAFGSESITSHSSLNHARKSFTLTRNLLISNGAPMFMTGYGCVLADCNHESDLNLFLDISGQPPRFTERQSATVLDFQGWRQLGHDRHGILLDPDKYQASLAELTAALQAGRIPIPVSSDDFNPFSLEQAGPRPPEQWPPAESPMPRER